MSPTPLLITDTLWIILSILNDFPNYTYARSFYPSRLHLRQSIMVQERYLIIVEKGVVAQ